MMERCGVCGGVLRHVVEGEHSIWVHLDITADHEPVLGTRVPEAVRLAAHPVEEPEPVVIPEPTVRSRPATDAEIPRGARTIMKKAIKHGWTVSAKYSRGPLLDASCTTILSEDTEAIVLKGVHHDVGIFDATWLFRHGMTDEKWAYDTSWCSLASEPGFHERSSTDLRKMIEAAEEASDGE